MSENKIILTIHPVHINQIERWSCEFRIQINNSVDNHNSFPNNNSEDIPDYLEMEELENILNDLRMFLKQNYGDSRINLVRVLNDSSEIISKYGENLKI